MAEPQSTTPAPGAGASTTSNSESMFFSQRARRQLGLFAAGAGFFLLSTTVTRRSIARRNKSIMPKFYQPSNRTTIEINGAVEAIEALSLATLNVASVGIMFTGGLLWAFNISSVDDMRKKVRKNIGVVAEPTDQDEEQEMEEWFATVLARKEFKALRGEFGVRDDGTMDKKGDSTKDKREDSPKKDDEPPQKKP
ncbi:uncharacterized protein L3040_006057 [Drepanopeziza brunnea f. sp. 'multigermtubi']|uniref:Altered inheritance of mitochondria protein 11 n=1 Tax=Marssonina brunnea f. sp. multigermtubi (strain MB_m1) TaxID=1072389 RepID=K1Y8U5_MARBU|nr:uncharacterized protein MBM_00677 [Drepanopeziza brunnea f. sp. 'multigermtubi' MB_m1]EKD21564.1 hypothetical protein MBM_00677 [Drepanopeziza brunnea f. sp. 'multigermtubi' MB_m1]KAJ5040401.1 hypothetical protein L3040_006057 [Drepanopeziza brunnea f. sp. 'multigermtubi']